MLPEYKRSGVWVISIGLPHSRLNRDHMIPICSCLLDVTWVAVKELKLSYYIGETLLFTIHTHCGNLI